MLRENWVRYMDIERLTSTVVETISHYLAALATGTANHATEAGAAGLWQLISTRLRASRLGGRVVDEMEEAPTDQARREALRAAVADEADRDQGFAAELARVV